MEYLLLMTTAGSLVFVGYCLWKMLFVKLITQSMKYKAVILVLLVYLIPWIWLKGIYTNIFVWSLRDMRVGDIEGTLSFADFDIGMIEYRTKVYRLQIMIACIWFVGAILMILIKAVIYFRKRHTLLSVAMECEDVNLENVVKRLQEEFHCKHVPEVFWIRDRYRTLTLGIWRPVIFLQREYEPEELYPILRHEMIHVVRKDLLWKVLMEFVCCLHWFNPLIYLVKYQFDFVCEASCDEHVVSGCAKAERDAYGARLVKNQKGCMKKIPFGSNLGNGRRLIEKRLRLIIGMKRVACWKKAISACIFGVLLLVNSMIALAYPDVYHFEDSSIEMAEDSTEGDLFWTFDYLTEGFDLSKDIILYDKQFVDLSKNIFPVNDTGNLDSCISHKVVEGYVQVHSENDKGGCTVDTYEATRCKNCKTVWIGTLYTTVGLDTCIH